MTHSLMSRAEFLALSTKLCEDLRLWVIEATQYHDLTPDRLAALNEAATIIDQQTTLLVTLKPGPAE
jgi:hypothetical protein